MAISFKTKRYIDKYVGGVALLFLKPFVVALGYLLKRDHRLDVRGRIVVIKLIGAGSLVIALPNLLGLRRSYPGREIVLLTNRSVGRLAAELRIFDRIEIVDHDRGLLPLMWTLTVSCFRLLGSDTVIELEVYSRLTTIISLLLLARNRLSFYQDDILWKRHLATHLLFFHQESGVYHFYDQLFGLIGVAPAPAAEIERHLRSGLARSPGRGEPSGETRIAVGHTCSAFAPERQLSAQSWKNVLCSRFLDRQGIVFEFHGGERDSPFADEIIAALSSALPKARFRNRCGCSFGEMIAAFSNSDEFWGIDSAPLHIARALGLKTTSYWGPTTPAMMMRDLDPGRDTVVYRKITCSPCVHIAMAAPCRGNNLCIKQITGVACESTSNPAWVID